MRDAAGYCLDIASTRRMASKIEWHRIPRATVVAEAVQWLVGVACLALGWVTLPLLYALAGVEVVLVVVISGVVYRQRGAGTIVWDAVKSLALWGFCGAFIIGAYAGAGGFANGLRVAPQGFAVLAAIVALRLGFVALSARASTDPRLQWTREAAMRGAVLALSSFFGAFACFVPGMLLVAPVALVLPDVAADVALGACLLGVQAFLALVCATMTPQELAEISRQPYLEPPR
jgi:hypothetical protein